MFALLFKYPPAVFSRGHLVLLGAWPLWLLALLSLAIAGALAWLLHRRLREPAPALGRRQLAVLWALELGTAVVLLVLLWRPAIAVSELEPQRNVVAVLVDDSRSMGLREGSATRQEQALHMLQSGWLQRLATRFQIRLYRFDTHITRIAGIEQLGAPDAPATHIDASLKELAEQTSELPVGAVVLLTDGGDNGGGIDRDTLEALRNRHIPVHTVGFGAASPAQDVEIEDVAIPARALAGARLNAQVRLREHGYRGQRGRLVVREGAKVLAARDVSLQADDAVQAQSVLFNVGAAGARSFEFSIEPLPGETNLANNTVTRIVSVASEPRRILYFEGEPRWEYKFIRRAADDDAQVQIVSMLRTTENKIYRQGIKDAQELADGFPTRGPDLFAYQALIIGSVDAGYFTPAQQQLIRDFVDRRGGGLLLLGGREALADGVWSGSLTADLLPVVLPEGRHTFHREHATVSLTPAGAESVICRLTDDTAANVQRWRKLPYLMDYEDPGQPKPGAAVLAEMHVGSRTMPLLVTERYGRGRTAVLATGGTWRWQMDLPLGDKTHDMFWQQLLRWLVSDTREHVAASVQNPLLLDDSHVRIAAEVRDENYQPSPQAHVRAHLIGPGGLSADIELTPIPNAPGRFQGEWTAPAAGTYVAEVAAQRGSAELGRDSLSFERRDGVAENFHTQQNRELLQRLAASTGGRYWQPEQTAALAAAIPYSAAGISAQQLKELWNMPSVFVLLLALRLGEWLLRRRWGIV